MITKVCSKCKEDKSLSDYYATKVKSGKVRVYSCCKSCWSIVSTVSGKKYRDKTNARQRLNYLKNPLAKRRDSKNHAEKHPEKIKERWREWYIKNREKQILKAKKRYVDEREKINKQRNISNKKKWNSDPFFRFKHSCRTRIGGFFRSKGAVKSKSTEALLGAPFCVAKAYIERQFTKGMSCDNYGKWHVDHKIPLGSAKTEEEASVLCHYTNLQPLWAKDNLSKNDTIVPTQMILTL